MSAPGKLHIALRTAVGLCILLPGLFLTSVVAFPSNAWGVSMSFGVVSAFGKSNTGRVWAVRGGP